MIRPRGGTTRRRDDQQEQAITTIVEIGRLLRSTREDRGLDLLAVHDRLGCPITQLEALENGDLAMFDVATGERLLSQRERAEIAEQRAKTLEQELARLRETSKKINGQKRPNGK